MTSLSASRAATVSCDPVRSAQPRDQKRSITSPTMWSRQVIRTKRLVRVTLGGITFDDLGTFEPLDRFITLIGVPSYNVIEVTNLSLNATTDHESDETFERVPVLPTTRSIMGRCIPSCSTMWSGPFRRRTTR